MRPNSRALRNNALSILAAAALLVAASKGYSVAATPAVTPVRVADAACAQCHRQIYTSYLATPMANASGAAEENLKRATFLHQASGEEYAVSQSEQGPLLEYSGKAGSGKEQLSYFLGSGHLGVTYLYSIGKYLFESPVAWYAPTQSYDMKPGLASMRTVPPPLPMQSGCMRCHMSAVQHSVPGSINQFEGAAFLHAGITCEECHGDASLHLKSAGKAAVVNPVRIDAERRDSICIRCHLEGDVSVAHAGKSAVDFKPGEAVDQYVSFYVKADAAMTQRGVSEVEQLSKSVCKRTSGDKMSCMSCHDPHYTPDAAHKVEFYRSKCLACHSESGFAQTHHAENRDCTSCHMPRSEAQNILHVAWTDHRILREPGKAPAVSSSAEDAALVPIFSPSANQRDLAMAYYQALLEGDRQYESKAWTGLNAVRAQINGDAEALDALGNMCAERGDLRDAEADFRQVLKLKPYDSTALSNLGVLLAKEGELSESIQYLNSAFERNEDVPGIAMNLARVECMAGDGAAAQRTLQTALTYSENFEQLRELLGSMTHCGDNKTDGTAK